MLTQPVVTEVVLFNKPWGTPELNEIPALFPKYQLFHSPCDKPKKGNNNISPVMSLLLIQLLQFIISYQSWSVMQASYRKRISPQ